MPMRTRSGVQKAPRGSTAFFIWSEHVTRGSERRFMIGIGASIVKFGGRRTMGLASICRLVAVSLVLVAAAACQAPRAAPPPTGASPNSSAVPSYEGRTLNIVTGGTGGVYIVYGAGLADILSKKMNVAASAQATAASVANMQLIRDGKADLAFTLADTAFDAFAGRDPFTPADKVDARTLA